MANCPARKYNPRPMNNMPEKAALFFTIVPPVSHLDMFMIECSLYTV